MGRVAVLDIAARRGGAGETRQQPLLGRRVGRAAAQVAYSMMVLLCSTRYIVTANLN